jgi:hypothetical protein
MTHQAPPAPALPGGDPGRQVAALREIQRLVGGLAGHDAGQSGDALLDEAARVSSAYERASPITQRRFDALAAETAAWAAAGVEALLAAGDQPSQGPAARLSGMLDESLERLGLLLRL